MSLTLKALVFQSFGSVGPALNFVAILPLMTIFAGSALPIATFIAFLISFISFIPTLIFSGSHADGTGYVSYVGESMGRKSQIFTGFLYIFYSSIVMPSILMFGSFFLISYYVASGVKIFEFFVSLIMLCFLLILLGGQRKFTQHFITSFGIIEIISVTILAIFLIREGTFSSLNFKPYVLLGSNFWEAVILGVLMFSGSGSSIFLSKQWKSNSSRFRSTLVAAYILVGAIMVISSVAVVVFMGKNIVAYGSDPVLLLTMSEKDFSAIVPPFIIALLLLSGFNLMLSYSNALLNMVENFQAKYSRESWIIDKNKRPLVLAGVWFIILVAFIFTEGYYSGFIIVAEVVSLCYVVIHGITGFAFFNSRRRKMYIRSLGLLSMILLGIALFGSLENSSTGFAVTLLIFIFLLLISMTLAIFIGRNSTNVV